jgi:hypothetical protein
MGRFFVGRGSHHLPNHSVTPTGFFLNPIYKNGFLPYNERLSPA